MYVFIKLKQISKMILDQKFKDFLLNEKGKVSLAILITNSNELDYVRVTEDGSISYRTKDKTVETGSDNWSAKGRTKVKPGKFINRILGETVTAGVISTHDIEQWVNKLKSNFSDLGEINIVAGDDISWCYNSENYTSPRGGSLWSCMSGRECQDRLDVYTKNPDTVKLVVQYDNNGKVKTRALLWTLEDGRQLMDRIYYQADHSYNTFQRLCKENSWLSKDSLCRDNKVFKFKSPIVNWAHKSYPYLDTMRFIEREDDKFYMTNHIDEDKRDTGYVIPNGTAGYTIHNHVDVNGEWVHRSKAGTCRVSGVGMLLKDLVEVPRHGTIDKKLAVKDKWGNLYFKDDLVESKIMNGFIPMKGAYQLKDSNDWIGRKKYRKMVADGRLVDGSAHYKGRTAWALEANIAKQEAEEAAIKSLLIEEINSINPRYARDHRESSIRRLFEVLNYTLSGSGLETYTDLADFIQEKEEDILEELAGFDEEENIGESTI